MGQFLRFCFYQEREAFFLDLRPKYVIPYLMQAGLLSEKERQTILNQKTLRRQVQSLISILAKNQRPEVFDCFVSALQLNNTYPWLAEKLETRRKSDGGNQNFGKLTQALTFGNVPHPANYLFTRKNLIYDIRTELMKASETKRHWVVLHGMAGSGKTVSGAESLRSCKIFECCFPKGICWLHFGKFLENSSNRIMIRMHLLWSKLLHNNPRLGLNTTDVFQQANPEISLAKVKDFLRVFFGEAENSNYLIVLDDVWDEAIINAFDFGCPILVTTRNKSVVDSVSSYCSIISFQKGLTLDDTKTYLSQFVGVDAEELPSADIFKIWKKSQGLPFTLSMVGGAMSRYGNNKQRWHHVSTEMEKGMTEGLDRRRHKSSSDEIQEMIKLSIQSLSVENRKYFYDFAIFGEDVPIPNKVLEILWDKERFEVEDIVQELCMLSLVCIDDETEEGDYSYTVHNLYLEFLKKECGPNEMKSRHRTLVDKYMASCESGEGVMNYGLFPNDGYIHYYISHHIYNGFDEPNRYFQKIFLDFNFIQDKLKYAGSSDLLFDFGNYRECFYETISEMTDVEKFIRRNVQLVCTKDSDFIQLALFEPQDSSVYKKAIQAAQANKDKVYFQWSNHGNVPYQNKLQIQLKFDYLRWSVFNSKNDIVASVGGHKSVVLWDSASGETLEVLEGASSSMNCVAFNPAGNGVAAACANGSVCTWKIDPSSLASKRGTKTKRNSKTLVIDYKIQGAGDNSLLVLFKGHKAEVLWCSFSSDGKMVVSSDTSGVVLVWLWEEKLVKHRFQEQNSLTNGANDVSCCQFSHDGKLLGAASVSTIYVWNLSTEQCICKFDHDEEIVNQFFFACNDRLIYSASTHTAWKWNLATKTSTVLFKNNSFSICCCCLSPDDHHLAIGTTNFQVIICQTMTPKAVAHLLSHKSAVEMICYSSSKEELLSACEDGTVIIWDLKLESSRSMVSFKNNLSVRFSEELTICSTDYLNCIQVRSGMDATLLAKSEPDECDITCCSLSYDCSEVVYGTKSGSVNEFSIALNRIDSFFPHKKAVTYIIHKKNSPAFITCSDDRMIRVWKSKSDYRVLHGHLNSVVMCKLFCNDEKLLSCSEDGTLRVWDLVSYEEIMVLEGHGNQKVNFCDISADEKYFCSASSDQTMKIWNAVNGQECMTLECSSCVRCCCFSPAGNILISGDDDGNIKMWDLDSGPIAKTLGTHNSWVTALKFSSDGSKFISTSDSTKIWDQSGELLQTIILPGSPECALWISPEFEILVLVQSSVLYILKRVV